MVEQDHGDVESENMGNLPGLGTRHELVGGGKGRSTGEHSSMRN